MTTSSCTTLLSEDDDQRIMDTEATVRIYLWDLFWRQTAEDDDLADRMKKTRNGQKLMKLLQSGKTPVFLKESPLWEICDTRVCRFITKNYAVAHVIADIDLRTAIGPSTTEDELVDLFESIKETDISIAGIDRDSLDFSFCFSRRSDLCFFISSCDDSYKAIELSHLSANLWILRPNS